MNRQIFVLLGIVLLSINTVSCVSPGVQKEPTLNVTPYLSPKEEKLLDKITFEVQKVLDTLDSFRRSNALDFITKLDIPGWKIEKKREKILFIYRKVFIAYKEFKLPDTCIKEINRAEVNVCHLKLTQSLERLADAYGCEVKTYSLQFNGLRERIEVICHY